MANNLTVGALAKRIGIRPSAVRFYERQGLVASERLANGYRVYDQKAVGTLRFINHAKALGFSLDEVHEILTLCKRGQEPCDCVRGMVERNLVLVDKRITELSRLRRQLRALSAPIVNSPRQRSGEAICPILESDVTRDR